MLACFACVVLFVACYIDRITCSDKCSQVKTEKWFVSPL